MGLSDIFKIKEYKAQMEALLAENERLKTYITPDVQDSISLRQKLQEKNQELESDLNSKSQ